MTDALEDHEGTFSIEGRTITNLHFADDIDGLAGEEEELVKVVERLNKASEMWIEQYKYTFDCNSNTSLIA